MENDPASREYYLQMLEEIQEELIYIRDKIKNNILQKAIFM